jgi:hypothetical protein
VNEHVVYYYPYDTFGTEQSLLFKAAVLYFDVRLILDPLGRR